MDEEKKVLDNDNQETEKKDEQQSNQTMEQRIEALGTSLASLTTMLNDLVNKQKESESDDGNGQPKEDNDYFLSWLKGG